MIHAAVITVDAYLEVMRERDEARAALLVLHHQHLEALESAVSFGAKYSREVEAHEATRREHDEARREVEGMRERSRAAEAQRDEAVSLAHESIAETVSARADAARLREALQRMVASAVPHPVSHPTMTRAWDAARAALESGVA